ncbi:hypothetical protein ON010_g7108 [Phytophthora cinnamomi]|nr:hypothetical protein ON010_g7108 [Phytophthora cinnamomi]
MLPDAVAVCGGGVPPPEGDCGRACGVFCEALAACGAAPSPTPGAGYSVAAACTFPPLLEAAAASRVGRGSRGFGRIPC